MFEWFKKRIKKKKNAWICVNKFWGCDLYIEELVEYPDDEEREVRLTVANGNVFHEMEGYYKKGEWWYNDWCPVRKSFLRKIHRGITVVAWKELTKNNVTK